MLEDGREIASDAHHGFAGMPDFDNTYLLEIRQLKPSAKYELAAQLSTDPGFKLPAGRAVESWGRVCYQGAGGEVVCRMPRNATLRQGQSLTQSFVMGVAPAGQMRRAFLYYLERERAHPYRPFLHYNSWYDIAWAPVRLERDQLPGSHPALRRAIHPAATAWSWTPWCSTMAGMIPRRCGNSTAGFPNGFTPLAELCRAIPHAAGRLAFPLRRLRRAEESNGSSSAASKATRPTPPAFRWPGRSTTRRSSRRAASMIRKFGVNHFKFDGIAAGMYASGGGGYVLDTEAMRRLMLELRQEDPNLYINLTTGSWPSPFWLRYADSVWRQGDDMGLAGKGPKQQQWLTYRDQETFRNIVRKGPLYPLNSLMTQGVAYSRQGMAGDPTFTSAGFKDDVRAFFGSGTGLQELYIQPGKLTAEDWRCSPKPPNGRAPTPMCWWTRTGSAAIPSKLEVYGYASWSPRKGIVMLRNPDDQPQAFAFEPGAAFELPPGAPRNTRCAAPGQRTRLSLRLLPRSGSRCGCCSNRSRLSSWTRTRSRD